MALLSQQLVGGVVIHIPQPMHLRLASSKNFQGTQLSLDPGRICAGQQQLEFNLGMGHGEEVL
jgi:hypothetical protein